MQPFTENKDRDQWDECVKEFKVPKWREQKESNYEFCTEINTRLGQARYEFIMARYWGVQALVEASQ